MAAEVEEKDDDNWSEAMTFDPTDQTSKDNSAHQVSSIKMSKAELPAESNAHLLPVSTSNNSGLAKSGGKMANDRDDKKPNATNGRREPRSEFRGRSRNIRQCQKHYREMIGRHEIRNEDLIQQEEELQQRLQALECSVPAVMIWNIWRMAQGASTSAIRRLAQKQFQGFGPENMRVPSTPSQHWDDRVRKIEAERKEALRRAEEARGLLAEKEAAVRERRKRLEEAKKCNQERKEKIEKLAREAAELREALKNARGDDNFGDGCEAGECGEIRCKEKWLEGARAGGSSASSIGSTDLESFAKLQELAEAEIGMKRQISELERREEAYMRTLQQADEMWSKMEGDTADTLGGLQDQLDAKTAANQQLADRICMLEDELERLKKMLITSKEALSKFTDKEYSEVMSGFDDGEAGVKDRAVAAAIKTAAVSIAATPKTLDQECLAYPEIMDKESSVTAPDVSDVGLSAFPKMLHRSSEAMPIAEQVDRGVEAVTAMGIDVHVGTEEGIPDPWKDWDWDQGCPPDIICEGPVECSTETEDSPPKGVPKVESHVQATPEMVEKPVAAPEIVEQPVSAPEIVEESVAPTEIMEQSVSAPEIVEQPVAAPEIVEQPVAAASTSQGDQISLSLEELRNWYNIVDSVHHTIAKRDSLLSKTDVIAQLAEKMKLHLRIKGPSVVKGPIIMDEIPKEPLIESGKYIPGSLTPSTGDVKEDIPMQPLIASEEHTPGPLTPPTGDVKEDIPMQPLIASEEHTPGPQAPSTGDIKEEILQEMSIPTEQVSIESAIVSEDYVPRSATPPTEHAKEDILIKSPIDTEEHMPEPLTLSAADIKEEILKESSIAPEEHIPRSPTPSVGDVKEQVPAESLIASEEPVSGDIQQVIESEALIDHVELPAQAKFDIPEKDVKIDINASPISVKIQVDAQPDLPEIPVSSYKAVKSELEETVEFPAEIIETADIIHTPVLTDGDVEAPKTFDDIADAAKLQADLLEKQAPVAEQEVSVLIQKAPPVEEVSKDESITALSEVRIKEPIQPLETLEKSEIKLPGPTEVQVKSNESIESKTKIPLEKSVVTPAEDLTKPELATTAPADEIPTVSDDEKIRMEPAEIPPEVSLVEAPTEPLEKSEIELPGPEEVEAKSDESIESELKTPFEKSVATSADDLTKPELPTTVPADETVILSDDEKLKMEPAEILPEESLVEAPIETLEKSEIELPGPEEVEEKSDESIESSTKIPLEESVITSAEDLAKPESATTTPADEVVTLPEDEKIREEPVEAAPEDSVPEVDVEPKDSTEPITELSVAESAHSSADDFAKSELLASKIVDDIVAELDLKTDSTHIPEDDTSVKILEESTEVAGEDILVPEETELESVDSDQQKEEPFEMLPEEADIKLEGKPDVAAEEIAAIEQVQSSLLTEEMPELVAQVSDLTLVERLESDKVSKTITAEDEDRHREADVKRIPQPETAIIEIQEGVTRADSVTKLMKDISTKTKVVVVPDRAVVAKPYLAIAKVESADKVVLPKPVVQCTCKPRTCPLPGQSTDRQRKLKVPSSAANETQTTSPIPKSLQERMDKQKLKTISGSTRSHSEVGMCRQATIWPRHVKDKSTLTTVCVDTQTDSALARDRDRIALAGITRRDDCTCSGTCPRKIEHGGPIQRISNRTPREKRTAPARCPTVAKPIGSAKFSTSTTSRAEKEMAVVRYTGRSPVAQASKYQCVECGRPITPEGTPLSTASPTNSISQKTIIASLKKLTSCTSRVIHRKGDLTCCECKRSSKLKIVDGSRDKKQKDKDSGKKRSDRDVCCPCPAEITGKTRLKSSKKKRKPEMKDQSTMAHIPKNTVKAVSKETNGTYVHKNKSTNRTASKTKFDQIQMKTTSKVMCPDTVSCCECDQPSNGVSIADSSCDCFLRGSISRGSSCNCIKDKT